jgi:DNA-binding LytR/AlgR family response regulator
MESKINCIVIDDETPALKLMEQFISMISDLKLVEKFKSPTKALDFLKENKVDIVFCDIRMNEMSGIELVQNLKNAPVVIFTTAYSEFAAAAFDLNAVDYLKKPFSFDRFLKAVNKAKEYVNIKLLREVDAPKIDLSEKDFIAIKADHKMIKVFYDDILFVEGFQEYIKIITTQQRYITFERMKNMELLLPADKFMRVHRSYIISKSKVKSMSGNLVEIGEHQIPVSRDLKEQVLKMLFN